MLCHQDRTAALHPDHAVAALVSGQTPNLLATYPGVRMCAAAAIVTMRFGLHSPKHRHLPIDSAADLGVPGLAATVEADLVAAVSEQRRRAVKLQADAGVEFGP